MVLLTGLGLKVTVRGGFDGFADSGDGGSTAGRRGVCSDAELSAMVTGDGDR